MLNTNFANAVLGALFGQGALFNRSITVSGSNAGYTDKHEEITAGLGESCYIGLLTNWEDNKALNELTEYTDGNYERVPLGKTEVVYKKASSSSNVTAELSHTTQLMDVPANNEIHNRNFIKFNPLAAGASNVTFKGFALYTGDKGGTAVYAAALKTPLENVKAGDVPLFDKGALSVSFGKDGDVSTQASANAEMKVV